MRGFLRRGGSIVPRESAGKMFSGWDGRFAVPFSNMCHGIFLCALIGIGLDCPFKCPDSCSRAQWLNCVVLYLQIVPEVPEFSD